MKKTLFALFAAAILLPSCIKDGAKDSVETTFYFDNFEITKSPSDPLLHYADAQIGCQSGTLYVDVVSNTSWTVETGDYISIIDATTIKGLEAYPLSGKGNGRITVKYKAYDKEVREIGGRVLFRYHSQGKEHMVYFEIRRDCDL